MRDINANELMDVGGGTLVCDGITVRLGDFSACIGYLHQV